jgi:hypothetical protein
MSSSSSRPHRQPSALTEREQQNVRSVVIRYFQEIVNAGCATWHTREDGQTELRLKHGTVFLLLDTQVARLK